MSRLNAEVDPGFVKAVSSKSAKKLFKVYMACQCQQREVDYVQYSIDNKHAILANKVSCRNIVLNIDVILRQSPCYICPKISEMCVFLRNSCKLLSSLCFASVYVTSSEDISYVYCSWWTYLLS